MNSLSCSSDLVRDVQACASRHQQAHGHFHVLHQKRETANSLEGVLISGSIKNIQNDLL